jgi:hypothetical protein
MGGPVTEEVGLTALAAVLASLTTVYALDALPILHHTSISHPEQPLKVKVNMFSTAEPNSCVGL